MVAFRTTAVGPCVLLALLASQCAAFAPIGTSSFADRRANFGARRNTPVVAPPSSSSSSPTKLRMGLDLVTYLRTEWVSAALCTNQTPREADVCLQLGTEDGRAVTFIPKTIRELITSSAEPDGKLSVGARRQLKQQQERRKAATIRYFDQPCDDLNETDDESVDIVISLQAAQRMVENGQDWKKSVREAARVLKPGGRLLFVEQSQLDGESYLEYVGNLLSFKDEDESEAGSSEAAQEESDGSETEEDANPVFECIGYDDVDLVIVPHVAGVFIKTEEAGMTPAERKAKAAADAKARTAELSISAFERGIKKRKKKKKKKGKTEEGAEATA
eukprot:CAMPEP_0183299756 /NCGR_PEP_ID=MMETSP0160_2-20130417/6396_1 /TAXON_ID=2839 ORGANISM="Odontella Sinensis, Strain Grunow 1884" /NCGR_SAMPLE_ID=MMETSP0160_2 /ASSEMBLY_ACC=CAM_ASM_000250 /LENGTH=331 /DNA_ID=CAMNT_0025462057 /DNA_START=66 /DNA_END=1061 /DNA_ORIENTATION=-